MTDLSSFPAFNQLYKNPSYEIASVIRNQLLVQANFKGVLAMKIMTLQWIGQHVNTVNDTAHLSPIMAIKTSRWRLKRLQAQRRQSVKQQQHVNWRP